MIINNNKNKLTMKKIMLIASAMLVSLTGALHAQNDNNILKYLEAAQATVKTKEEKAFKDQYTSSLGEGWKDTWRNSTLPRPNDHLVEIYIEKGDFPINNFFLQPLESLTVLKKQELLTYIGGKTKLTKNDFIVVKTLSKYNASTAARKDDFVKFLNCGPEIKGEEYFKFLISNLEVRGLRKFNIWQSALKTSEWFTLASANSHFSPVTFATGRDAIAMKAARLLLEKRKAENLSVEGKEFDAAFAPILDALKAPKFAGLAAACATVGIDMDLTISSANIASTNIDWSAQEAIAATVIAAAERNGKFITAWGVELGYEEGLGSVMFIKGESAYNTWREETIDKDNKD